MNEHLNYLVENLHRWPGDVIEAGQVEDQIGLLCTHNSEEVRGVPKCAGVTREDWIAEKESRGIPIDGYDQLALDIAKANNREIPKGEDIALAVNLSRIGVKDSATIDAPKIPAPKQMTREQLGELLLSIGDNMVGDSHSDHLEAKAGWCYVQYHRHMSTFLSLNFQLSADSNPGICQEIAGLLGHDAKSK